MDRRARRTVLAAVLVVAWFGAVVVWATRSFDDGVPVGTDYTVDPPAAISVDVACNSPLSSAPRGSEPLPLLTAQPPDRAPLGYSREPCRSPYSSARVALVIDAVVFAGALAAFVAIRRRTSARLMYGVG